MHFTGEVIQQISPCDIAFLLQPLPRWFTGRKNGDSFPRFSKKTIKAGPNNPLPSINCNQVQSISMCYIYIMIIIIIITTIIYSSIYIYIYTQPNTIIIFPLENRHLSRWRLAIPSHKPGGAAGSRHIGIGEAPGLGEGDQQVVGHVVPGGTR